MSFLERVLIIIMIHNYCSMCSCMVKFETRMNGSRIRPHAPDGKPIVPWSRENPLLWYIISIIFTRLPYVNSTCSIFFNPTSGDVDSKLVQSESESRNAPFFKIWIWLHQVLSILYFSTGWSLHRNLLFQGKLLFMWYYCTYFTAEETRKKK